MAYDAIMAYALTREQEQFINRMVREGGFNNQSEVVREALRRMEREQTSYLNPPPLTTGQVEKIYGPNARVEARERDLATAAMRSIRRRRSRA